MVLITKGTSATRKGHGNTIARGSKHPERKYNKDIVLVTILPITYKLEIFSKNSEVVKTSETTVRYDFPLRSSFTHFLTIEILEF